MPEASNLTTTAVRAEMARGGLLPWQLRPWWNPDTEKTCDPLTMADTQHEVRRFVAWLEEQTRGA